MDRYELRRLDYSLSEDHQAIQEAYKQFFKTHCPIETVRAAEESGFDKSLWERLCAMGATTMALPESAGGDGATLVDLTLELQSPDGPYRVELQVVVPLVSIPACQPGRSVNVRVDPRSRNNIVVVF